MVRHAYWLVERFRLHRNGFISLRLNSGAGWRGDLVAFAEVCLFRWSVNPQGEGAKGRKVNKADLVFAKEVFLGRRSETNEYIFGAPDGGVFYGRTLKRLPAAVRNNTDLIKSLCGVPWDRQGELPRGRQVRSRVPVGPGKAA